MNHFLNVKQLDQLTEPSHNGDHDLWHPDYLPEVLACLDSWQALVWPWVGCCIKRTFTLSCQLWRIIISEFLKKGNVQVIVLQFNLPGRQDHNLLSGLYVFITHRTPLLLPYQINTYYSYTHRNAGNPISWQMIYRS
jgi:hypothetical protein